VTYLGYGWHGTWHGRHFDVGAKLLGKMKTFTYSFLNVYFASHTFLSRINTVPLPNALSRPCCTSITRHYNKTVVLWSNTMVRHCDEQECSLTVSTKPRPSHVIT